MTLGLAACLFVLGSRDVRAQYALPSLFPRTSATETDGSAEGTRSSAVAPQVPGDSGAAGDRERPLPEPRRDWPHPLAPIRRGLRLEAGESTAPERPTEPVRAAAVSQVATAPQAAEELQVTARFIDHWREGAAEVYLLRGDCQLTRGEQAMTCRELVLWKTPLAGTSGAVQVTVYLEGDVRFTANGRQELRPSLGLQLTAQPLVLRSEYDATERSTAPDDPLYTRALARREPAAGAAQQTQFLPTDSGAAVFPAAAARPVAAAQPGLIAARPMDMTQVPPGTGPVALPVQFPAVTPALAVQRRVTIYPRAAGQSFSIQTHEETNVVPPEFVTSITGGVRIVIDGVPLNQNGQIILTTLDLAADRAVIWTDAERVREFSTNFNLDHGSPFEVYLEGNIEVRQGSNLIRASRAFYDVSEERGLFLDTELRGFIPELNTPVRLRAQEIRQLSHDQFQARNAWVTTSEMGIPGYRIEASDLFLERRPVPGYTTVNPETGEAEGGMLWFRSFHNRLYLENVPVAYYPYISSPAEDPGIPLRNLSYGYSRMFGNELRTYWDPEALFGLKLPDGASWGLNVDYLSRRGPGAGTNLEYHGGLNVFGIPARSSGRLDGYYIHDTGLDMLGVGRMNLVPSTENRGRLVGRNRIDFPFNTSVITELGWLSDRNVREQYWENEWDQGKDYESLVDLIYQSDNFTGSVLARQRLFNFENTTNWLPRLDATLLAEPVGATPLLWSTHSSVGYAHLQPAAPPPNTTADPFQPLPFFADRQGVVAMTRHELDLPMSAGPVNLVPYVLGEAAYWQEDLAGNELGRLYGSAGVRASLMVSKYMPQVFSPVFGLNGLAHKMVFDADYSYSQSSVGLSQIAQYNEFDEDAQERFRERFVPVEFGGLLPATFDPRFYAVRAGAGRSVTAPWYELVDDQQVVRLGWRHRLQTRVGNPQQPRIYDWMTLDLEASVFPNASRDNFNETLGLISARYAWNVGPRTSLLANTTFDLFDPGQEIWNVGVLSSRASRGSVYVGVRGIKAGPIDTALLIASMSYHPSDKWSLTAGTAYDLVEQLDRGQSLTVTRVGEYLLFTIGAGYDRTRNVWSCNFSVSPKFGNVRVRSTQLSSLQGMAL